MRSVTLFLRRFVVVATAVLLTLSSGAAAPVAAHAGTGDKPRARTAHTVTFDKYSLMVDGKRLHLWGGEFHYWRLPSPDLWRDVLQKMKAAGFNAASIYFHWGYHSPAPGVYDFTGVRDVDRLLDIANEVGIYVIARPGPYINAETDEGGLPAWLDRLPGKKRSPDPDYVRYADEWLSHIDPILARHQLTNGTGTIIIDQVENEFYEDDAAGNAYLKHLKEKFRADGITVPLTGNHEGMFNDGEGALDIDGWDHYPQWFNCATPDAWRVPRDFAPVRATLTDRPLYLGEYQGGSFDPWGGNGYEKCRAMIGSAWEKVYQAGNIADGATMQSFYMTYGGTSWGFLPFPGVYTSYDYGAAIDESRQLTAKYDTQKLFGHLLAAAAPLAKTDLLTTAAPPENKAVWSRVRINPDDHTQLHLLRHTDITATSRDRTHLSLDLSGRTDFTHDDTDAAVHYAGAWTHASGQDWTAGDYRDTESFSATTGDTVTVPFRGTGVRWISSNGSNHGIASVSVDGKPGVDVDTYAASKQYQEQVFSASGLADGEHTLTITATGRKNSKASGAYVAIDAIDVPPASTDEYYPQVPQQPGTAITLGGRDAKLLLANYAFGGQKLAYSTSQLLTQVRLDDRDVAVFHAPAGEDGETVLRYASRPTVTVLAGTATSSWDATRGDLRLNYTHAGLARVLVSGGGRNPLELLLTDEPTATEFSPLHTTAGDVLIHGPRLVRTATARPGVLALTGDTDANTPLTVWAPKSMRSVRWNGAAVRMSPLRATASGAVASPAGAQTGNLTGPRPVTLPALTWRYQQDTPEADPGFDDSGWTLADHVTSINPTVVGNIPVLAADDYGFHHGNVWYRGHFTAAGTETALSLNAMTGNSTGQYAVWLNGSYLGVGNGAKTWTAPAGVLRKGRDNVVSVLVANMGHNQGGGKSARGLVSARLLGSTASLTWRIQGGRGGEAPIDTARGPMNTGGLHGERVGATLPGYPDAAWPRVTLPHADNQPGIAWYRSAFTLGLPADQDVPVALQFSDDPARHYRAQIYLNGWNLGLYVNDVGPQRTFPLPTGLLRADGRNTLALAVWSNDSDGGLGAVRLVALGNHRGGVRTEDVAAPGYSAARYAEPPAPARVTLTGPDRVDRGGTAKLTARVAVPAGRKPVRSARVTLQVPAGWKIGGPKTVRVGPLLPGRATEVRWRVTVPTGEQPWGTVLRVDARADGRAVTAGRTVVVSPPAPTGSPYVSELEFLSTNGWGPVERDASNGEDARDGLPITLNGTRYTRGLGVHADSKVSIFTGGACSRFTATVGVDDEAGNSGSVTFAVVADDRTVAQTGTLTGASASVPLDVDVAGAQWVDLVVGDAGNGNGHDHADWADARLSCR